MRVGRVLKPGAPGTKRLMSEFGERLLLVRYRYDEVRCRSIKTVEVIVDERYWNPEHSKRLVKLVIAPDANEVWQKVREAGGVLNRKTWHWELPYCEVRKLELLDWIYPSK